MFLETIPNLTIAKSICSPGVSFVSPPLCITNPYLDLTDSGLISNLLSKNRKRRGSDKEIKIRLHDHGYSLFFFFFLSHPKVLEERFLKFWHIL